MLTQLAFSFRHVKLHFRVESTIYNDQGWISKYWRFVKRQYNAGWLRRAIILVVHIPYFYFLIGLVRIIKGKWRVKRGMSRWYDLKDWLGGYPFEVAQPREVIGFLSSKGFSEKKMKTCGRRQGCNEYVLQRTGK